MPLRGVRTTSGSGGTASPAPSTSSAAAARAGLPETSWCTDSASSRSATASWVCSQLVDRRQHGSASPGRGGTQASGGTM